MPRNNQNEMTVSAIDPRQVLRNEMDSIILNAKARNKELAALRKQLDRETEANEEAIRIAEAAVQASQESLTKSSELALAEAI